MPFHQAANYCQARFQSRRRVRASREQVKDGWHRGGWDPYSLIPYRRDGVTSVDHERTRIGASGDAVLHGVRVQGLKDLSQSEKGRRRCPLAVGGKRHGRRSGVLGRNADFDHLMEHGAQVPVLSLTRNRRSDHPGPN